MRITNIRQITRLCAALVINVSLLAVSTASAVITAVPTGLSAGDTYRLVVVTVGKTDATSSDANYYNTFVNDDIATNGTDELKAISDWTAIISSNRGTKYDVDARDNTSTNNLLETGVPIYNLNDQILASNYGEFWDYEIDNPVNYASDGVPFNLPNAQNVWTGTSPLGTGAFGVGDAATLGSASNSDFTWVKNFNGASKRGLAHVYAISPILIVDPANSTGTTTTSNQTWINGASYDWEINDSDGTAGGLVGWDLVDITANENDSGSLDLSQLTTGGFGINIISLDTLNAIGAANGFDDPNGEYEFVILTTVGGITGFDAENFVINDAGFQNSGSWDWSIEQDGNNLVLSATGYTLVPEPSSTALLALGGLAVMLRRKRS